MPQDFLGDVSALQAVALLAALAAGYLVHKLVLGLRAKGAGALARRIIQEAEREAETKKRESRLEAKDELYRTRARFEEESQERRKELKKLERRLGQREENLDRKLDLLEKKDRDHSERSRQLSAAEKDLQEKKRELDALAEQERKALQRVSGMSAEEARRLLLSRVEEEVREEAAVIIKRAGEEAARTSEKKAREIVSLAIQRCAADHVVESTVSVVTLPNDEMKGRIIGREGRNIRALENATGINVIIDDTPEAVILSGFDQVRRETARISLERLISDGRIHPARIEDVVAKVKQEMEVTIREVGEKAAFDIGVHGLHQEEIKLLGRLKYRTSYGQNVLQHSKETAILAGIMAAELGMDEKLARRTGLLHDIGKAVDHEVEGTHVGIGVELARKFGESAVTLNAIASHHNDEEPTSVLAVLIQAADAVSAARPGARRETLEIYVKRLERLERLAESFKGVQKAYAIQAGREVRVMVQPEDVSDLQTVALARDISKQVEEDLEYPGQIKVTLIRETRVVDYAR